MSGNTSELDASDQSRTNTTPIDLDTMQRVEADLNSITELVDKEWEYNPNSRVKFLLT